MVSQSTYHLIFYFQVLHCLLIFDILNKLADNFGQRDIELILVILKSKHIGFVFVTISDILICFDLFWTIVYTCILCNFRCWIRFKKRRSRRSEGIYRPRPGEGFCCWRVCLRRSVSAHVLYVAVKIHGESALKVHDQKYLHTFFIDHVWNLCWKSFWR